jgi:hypothetical protein
VSDEWPDSEGLSGDSLTEVLWLRKQAAMEDADYTKALEICRELEKNGVTNTLEDACKCQLYLENPEAALESCERALQQEMAKAQPQPLPLKNLRMSVLLELGRYQEVVEEAKALIQSGGGGDSSTRVSHVMALLYLDRNQDAESELQSLSDDPLFEAYVRLALKQYPQCCKQADRHIEVKGWQASFSGNAVVVGVLAGWLGSESPSETKRRLRQALRDCPRAWPYPLLRFLNGELSEAQLLALADGNLSNTIEAKFTIALTLIAQRRDLERARQMLQSFVAHGQYFESLVAHVFSQ